MSLTSQLNFFETHEASPLLPFDILEKVIQSTWLLSLSAPERINVMCCLPLVNADFYRAFRRVSLTDAFIPHPKYLSKFTDIVRSDFWDHLRRSKSPNNQVFSPMEACRSITFLYDLVDFLRTTSVPGCDWDTGCFAGKFNHGHNLVVEHGIEFSVMINNITYLPNVDHIGFQFADIDSHRVLEFLSVIKFPNQIKSLSIEMSALDRPYLEAARSFRCKTCFSVDGARSWKKWNFNLRQLKELTINGSVGDITTIGQYVIPTKESGGTLEKLHLEANDYMNDGQKLMIKRLYGRV